MPHRHQLNPLQLNDREQLQYLLGNPPSWMMRYGISVLFGLFGIMLLLSYFIHYPDTVPAKVVLTTENPPIRIIANAGGRVQEILVTDKAEVSKGQVLAVIENTAKWRDIISLEQWLSDSSAGELPKGLMLGELQNAYTPLVQHWNDRQYFERYNGVSEKIALLQAQIQEMEQIKLSQTKQISNLEQDYNLAEKTFWRTQQLHSEKIISDEDLETSEIVFLGHKRQLESARTTLFQNDLQIRQLQAQINDLKQGKLDETIAKKLTVSADLQRLASALSAWKQTYLVVAPIAGHVSFSRIWSPQQGLQAGEEVMAVVPAEFQDSRALLGKVQLPVGNAGRILPGQKAILKLDGYPEQEYGVVEAKVASISLLPQQQASEAVYLLDLELPSRLWSSNKRKIPFRQEMSGEVRIITEDRRVLERIFSQLKTLVNRV